MSGAEFSVNISSGFSNPDVKNLSDTEKSLARAMGFTEDQFRRSKIDHLAKELAKEERARARGRELGEAVNKILGEISPDYRLTRVNWNSDSLSWTLEIDTNDGPRNVVISWELADDVLDSRTQNEFQRLRNMVLFGLGRTDLIFRGRE